MHAWQVQGSQVVKLFAKRVWFYPIFGPILVWFSLKMRSDLGPNLEIYGLISQLGTLGLVLPGSAIKLVKMDLIRMWSEANLCDEELLGLRKKGLMGSSCSSSMLEKTSTIMWVQWDYVKVPIVLIYLYFCSNWHLISNPLRPLVNLLETQRQLKIVKKSL